MGSGNTCVVYTLGRQRYNEDKEGVDRAALEKGEEGFGRCAMDVTVSGAEIHALRELVEEAVVKLEKEIKRAIDPKTAGTLKESREIFKKIMEKLPVEFGTVS